MKLLRCDKCRYLFEGKDDQSCPSCGGPSSSLQEPEDPGELDRRRTEKLPAVRPPKPAPPDST